MLAVIAQACCCHCWPKFREWLPITRHLVHCVVIYTLHGPRDVFCSHTHVVTMPRCEGTAGFASYAVGCCTQAVRSCTDRSKGELEQRKPIEADPAAVRRGEPCADSGHHHAVAAQARPRAADSGMRGRSSVEPFLAADESAQDFAAQIMAAAPSGASAALQHTVNLRMPCHRCLVNRPASC